MDEQKNVFTIENITNKFLNWFDAKKRLAFFTTFILGIIGHIVFITGIMMSQDGLWNSMKFAKPGNWEIVNGRWGITLIEGLHNYIAIPSITVILCIVIISLASIILTKIFEFKNKIYIILTSAALILSATFTSTMLYLYTSTAYCFCMLISCLAVYFAYNFKFKKIGIFLSSLCIMFSLSIYQSYIGVTAGLMVMILIIDLIKSDKKIKEILIDAVRFIISGVLGVLLYYVFTMIILKVNDLNMVSRGNIDISLIISSLPSSIINAYKDFFAYFFRDRIIMNGNYKRHIFYKILFVCAGLISLLNLIFINEENKKNKVLRILLVIFAVGVLPVALNMVDIIVPGNIIYSLTSYQLVCVIPFVLALIEIINYKNEKIILGGEIIKIVAIINCFIVVYTNYLAINTSYTTLQMSYNQAYSTMERIIDKIEDTKGYKRGMHLLIAGIIGDNNYPRSSNLYQFTWGEIFNNPVFHGSYAGQNETTVNFIQVFFGLDTILCDNEDYIRITTSKEFAEMPMFPEEGSVKLFDDIMVVKVNEIVPQP